MSQYLTLTSNGIKDEGALIGKLFDTEQDAQQAFDAELKKLTGLSRSEIDWRMPPKVHRVQDPAILESGCIIKARLHSSFIKVVETSPSTPLEVRGSHGWRAQKGPVAGNTSGFRATGHRLLLLPDPVEEVTTGGIIITSKTQMQDEAKCVVATVIEIGQDAWSDKSTDFCAVGDRVLIGEYVGKLHTSLLDGKRYRFVNDLDIITPLEGV